jgi:hypothetical protein
VTVFSVALPWHVGQLQVSSSLTDSYSSLVTTSDSQEVATNDLSINKPDTITNKTRTSSRIKKIPITKKDDFLW